MRFRFTIRDLLWLAALVAVCVAWWLDHLRNEQTARDNAALRMKVKVQESSYDSMARTAVAERERTALKLEGYEKQIKALGGTPAPF